MTNTAMADKIKTLWPSADIKARFHNQLEVKSSKEEVVGLLTLLKSEGFEHLSNLTCVDWLTQGQFQVTYNLWSYSRKLQLTLKVFVDRKSPTVPTVMHLWPQTQVYEQEIHEMFGVDFPGNPDLTPFFLHNWKDIPPLRKDFDTREYAIKAYGAEEKQVKGE